MQANKVRPILSLQPFLMVEKTEKWREYIFSAGFGKKVYIGLKNIIGCFSYQI